MRLPALNVFVSSTWHDLRPERAAILDVTQRIKQLTFAGMEYFGSRNETTHQASIDEVDRSDLYIGIIAGRYGSGITEQEYLRARERGIPCFIYLKSEHAIDTESVERDPVSRQHLIEFKKCLHQHHTCSEFASPEELAFKLATDLHNWLFEKNLNSGLANLSTDYAARVQGFVTEYVGGTNRQVPFGGRNAELNMLNDWLANAVGPQYFLIAAGAGRGKSALLVHWTRELLTRDDIAVLFFPISIRFRTNLESVVFASLATYLATIHGEQLSLPPDTPSEVYRSQVAEYLVRPLTNGRQLLLVLDGLDEAADWSVGADLFPPQLSRSARVVVSARFLAGDISAGDWLRRLGWDTTGVAQSMDLSPLSEGGVADVLENMGFPLRELGSHTDIVNELHRLSGGDPLLVRLYVDDLWNRGEEATRLKVDDLQTIRPGLEGFFARWWDDQRKLWGSTSNPLRETRVQTILNYLAGAFGPLSRDDLLELANTEDDLNTWALEEALEPLRRFITGDGVQQGYVYSHPRLGIYFLERLSSSERKKIDQKILDWCANSVQDDKIEDSANEKISPYIVQYFGAHLERSQASMDRFELLLSNRWRKAWLNFDGTYAGFRADVRRVWRASERIHKLEVGSGSNPNRLALEVRCAFCIASVDQLSENTPPELIGALLEKSLWPTTAALGYASLIKNTKRRAQAFVCLVNLVSEQIKNRVLQEALEAISKVDEEADQVSLLRTIAPQLSTAVMSQAMAITLGFSQKPHMVEALLCLAPRLSNIQVEQVVQAARKLKDDDLRSEFLRTMAAIHPVTLIQKLHTSLGETDAWERTWIMLGASDSLAGDAKQKVLEDLLNTINTIDIHSGRLELMFLIIDRFDSSRQTTIANEVYADILDLHQPLQKAKALSKLAIFMRGNKRKEVVQQAILAIQTLSSETWQAKCMAWLAPTLDLAQQSVAISLAMEFSDESMQVKTLAALIPHLSEPFREHAISALYDIDDPFEKALGAAQVAEFLSEAHIELILYLLSEEELSTTWRYSLLRDFAPYLNPMQRDYIIDNIPYQSSPLEELSTYAALVPYSSGAKEKLISSFKSIRIDDWRWFDDDEELFHYLGEIIKFSDQITTMQITESILNWPNNATKLKFLHLISPNLSATQLERITELIFSWDNKEQKLEAISSIAAYVPAPLLRRMLQEAQVIGDDTARQQLLLTGLKLLPIQDVKKSQMWDKLSAITQAWLLIDWFDENSQLPPDDTLTEIVNLITHIQDDAQRAEAISRLINHYGKSLKGNDINQLLLTALSLPPEYYKTNAIAKISPYLNRDLIFKNFTSLFQAALDPSPDGIALATEIASQVPESLFITSFLKVCEMELIQADGPNKGNLDQKSKDRIACVSKVITKLPQSHQDSAKTHLVNMIHSRLNELELGRFGVLVRTDETTPVLFEMYLLLAREEINETGSLKAILLFIKQMNTPLAIEVVSDLVDWSLKITEVERLYIYPNPMDLLQGFFGNTRMWELAIYMYCLPKLTDSTRPLAIGHIVDITNEGQYTELALIVLKYLLPYATGDKYRKYATELLQYARNEPNIATSAEHLYNIIPLLQAEEFEQASGDAIILIQKSSTLIADSSRQDHFLEYTVCNLLTTLLPRVTEARALQLWMPFSRISTEDVLMVFIQHMPSRALANAVDVILHSISFLDSSLSISNTLSTLGNRLGTETPKKYINTVEALEDPAFRAITFSYAMPYLPDDMFQRTGEKALKAASDIGDISERVIILQGMLRICKWPQLIQLTLESVGGLKQHDKIVRACAEILPDLEEPYRYRCAAMALITLKQIEDENKRAGLLQELSSLLPEEAFDGALELLSQLSDPAIASRVGISLLQYSPPNHVPELLKITTHNFDWLTDERAPRIIYEKVKDPELAKMFFDTLENASPEIKQSPQYIKALRILTPFFGWFCTNAKAPTLSYYTFWHDILVLATVNKRSQLIDTIRELLPATKVLGGLECVEEITQSVTEITTWWP